MKQYCIYILANKKNGTLYIGVTGNLLLRIAQHKKRLVEGFTKKYKVDGWFILRSLITLMMQFAGRNS